MSVQPIIEVHQLTKHYGRTVGVEGVTFKVTAGEVFGFLGPNGAGKTTTIRLLLGLIQATSGSARMFGEPIPARSLEALHRCGYLPGNFVGYAHLTGREFLSFAARIRRAVPVLEAPLLERFELTGDTLKKKVRHLSHGTRQKLGIVTAFFHRPELLILDEPTSGLDPLMQQAFYNLLRETADDGRTVFFSSHVLHEIEKTCSRVAIVRDGALVGLETLNELRRRRHRRLVVTLKHDVGEIAIPGASQTHAQGLQREFVFQGDAGALAGYLADLPVEDFVFPEADLEDVFMAYYRSEER